MRLTAAQLIDLIKGVVPDYGIDPRVAVKQLSRESVNFNPYYVYGPGTSPKGAQGLAQFIPGTWQRYGKGSPYDPANAVDAYGKYMRKLLDQFGGRYDLALAAYNWGEDRAAIKEAYRTGAPITAYNIPDETRKYVTSILGAGAVSSATTNEVMPARNVKPIDSEQIRRGVILGVMGILILIAAMEML